MILQDAAKEFESSNQIGFGVDGDELTGELDFKAVRGAYEENGFVSDLRNETRDIEEKADRIITLLEKAKLH